METPLLDPLAERFAVVFGKGRGLWRGQARTSTVCLEPPGRLSSSGLLPNCRPQRRWRDAILVFWAPRVVLLSQESDYELEPLRKSVDCTVHRDAATRRRS
jgi:hypothetical protein